MYRVGFGTSGAPFLHAAQGRGCQAQRCAQYAPASRSASQRGCSAAAWSAVYVAGTNRAPGDQASSCVEVSGGWRRRACTSATSSQNCLEG